MGKKRKNSFDELDQLLLDARRLRADKDRPSASLSSVPLSKRVMEFAQFFKAVKYRDMRKTLSLMAECKKLEAKFIEIAEKKLPFKPDSWTFFFLKERDETTPPAFIPKVFERGRGPVAKVEELMLLLKTDEEAGRSYDDFEECWLEMEHSSYAAIEWIREQFRNDSLESKLEHFKNQKIDRAKTRMSKALVSNLIDPDQAKIVKETGELPTLSIGEREALQFLLWKIDNMTDREKHIKDNWILEGKEERPKENGFIIVFEKTEALKKSYGEDVAFSGKHFSSLEKSLVNLLEKKRKLVLEKKGETMEISKTLINHLEMNHKFTNEPGFRNYVAVWIPYDVAHLHDKLYTSYPANHFELMRNTPPETKLTESEAKFFDILFKEMPHDRNKKKTAKRMKSSVIESVGGAAAREHENQSRVAGRIEALFAPKAVNMGLLKRFEVYANIQGEEVYEWEYSEKATLNRLLNEGKTPEHL